jgi:CubicO group peptidase (beta-lactamase class C family)
VLIAQSALAQRLRSFAEKEFPAEALSVPTWAENPKVAALLAAEFEQRDQPSDHEPVTEDLCDRRWWVSLKNKLAPGHSLPTQTAPHPVVLSKPSTAPVVHEGAPEAAGIDPNAIATLDHILSDAVGRYPLEPISVCLVRRGTAFFRRSYGQWNGKTIALDERCPIHSVTKAFAGALMLSLVDERLVKLDASPAQYLPALRSVRVPDGLTVRSLFTFTSGLVDAERLEYHNDLEEIVADYVQHVHPGRYKYISGGYPLAGKVAEAVTGTPLHDLYRQRLLDPLGISRSTVIPDSNADGRSTSLDLARLAQLLLNRGEYGNFRFFSADIFADSFSHSPNLRTSNTALSNSAVDYAWALGIRQMTGDQWGNGVLYADASNASILIIDLSHQFIIAVASPGVHKDLVRGCYPNLYATIVKSLRD